MFYKWPEEVKRVSPSIIQLLLDWTRKNRVYLLDKQLLHYQSFSCTLQPYQTWSLFERSSKILSNKSSIFVIVNIRDISFYIYNFPFSRKIGSHKAKKGKGAHSHREKLRPHKRTTARSTENYSNSLSNPLTRRLVKFHTVFSTNKVSQACPN